MKIAIYTIAFNEIKFAERWATANKDADYLIVADTGSADGTVEKLRELGVTVYSIKIKPWRFDDARNIALSLVPDDVDICISCDMDELMAPGWRLELEKHWVPGTTKLRYRYIHSFDSNHNPLHGFMADKLHSRFGYRWQRPVHETIFPTGDEQIVTAPSVVMWHKQDPEKSRSQYLPLLEMCHKEFPNCSQTCYWLAREYHFSGQPEPAIDHFKKYLAMPEAGWSDERSEACKYLSILLPHEKVKWLRMSVVESPTRREAWLNLADYYYGEADWINLYAAAKEGLKLSNPSGSYLDYPHAWGGHLWDLAGLGAWNLGIKEESYKLFKTAYELEPNNQRINTNYTFVKNALNKE